ncbi:MAG: type II secretion system secretin GspD [Proteobacteria bacterium]|nr:type II secretion system secretin GspD [Pseudomonadota bacterium]
MKEKTKRHTPIIFFIGLIFFLTIQATSFAEDTSSKKPLPDSEAQEKFVSIDFNNVDIAVFIKFISELTNTNFIIDDKVKGKVTIISPSKISADEAYKVFESVLEVYGFATVKSGEVTKIVPSPEARTKNIKTLISEEARDPDDKLVTQLISLKYADPDEIKRLVAPLISKNSVMLAYSPTGTLIVTDVYSNIQRLMGIIKIIDVTDVGQNISVIPLLHADSTKVSQILDNLFKTTLNKKRPREEGKVVKFVPDERTNSIILLASEVDTNRVNELISMLDKEMPRGKEKIHVYYLENATAEELAKVLQSLSGKKSASPAKGGKKDEPLVSENVTITADKATNSLIMMAEKDEYMVLEDIIKKLDIPRAMVYIECLIVEVNINKSFNIGAEWTTGKEVTVNDTNGGAGIGFSGNNYANTAMIAGRGEIPGVSTFPNGFAMGVFGESLKIGDVLFPNLGAVINAMKSDSDVNILSTPQILTTDNEEASITVGKNVPYLTQTGSTASVDSYNNFDYKNVGKILKITPQISKDRQVRLKINFEVTQIVEDSKLAATTPSTLKRTIDTTVIVQDKNTVVIGGLIDDSLSTTQYKVPCLGAIPLLGYLFKSFTNTNDKTNLFIFLTPHVVGNPDDASKIMDSKRDQIETVKKGNIKLYGDSEVSKEVPEEKNDSE